MVDKLLTKPFGRYIGGGFGVAMKHIRTEYLMEPFPVSKVCFVFDVSPRGNDPIWDTLDGKKSCTTQDVQNPVSHGIKYQSQLVIARFLNHQQYDVVSFQFGLNFPTR